MGLPRQSSTLPPRLRSPATIEMTKGDVESCTEKHEAEPTSLRLDNTQ